MDGVTTALGPRQRGLFAKTGPWYVDARGTRRKADGLAGHERLGLIGRAALGVRCTTASPGRPPATQRLPQPGRSSQGRTFSRCSSRSWLSALTNGARLPIVPLLDLVAEVSDGKHRLPLRHPRDPLGLAPVFVHRA